MPVFMPDLQSCWYILQGDILSNQDTIFKEIITREIGWNKKRCCCCRRGEKNDCCSNLVFTENGTRTWAKNLYEKDLYEKREKTWEKNLRERLVQWQSDPCVKNLREKGWYNGNRTPRTNSCYDQLQTLKATQFDSIQRRRRLTGQ